LLDKYYDGISDITQNGNGAFSVSTILSSVVHIDRVCTQEMCTVGFIARPWSHCLHLWYRWGSTAKGGPICHRL